MRTSCQQQVPACMHAILASSSPLRVRLLVSPHCDVREKAEDETSLLSHPQGTKEVRRVHPFCATACVHFVYVRSVF